MPAGHRVALFALILSTAAVAGDVREIRMKSGDSIRGKVLEMTAEAVTLELEQSPGSRISITIDRIAPADVFELAIETFHLKSCDDWLKVAGVAESRKLPGYRVEALLRAVKADPGRKAEVQPLLDAAWADLSKARGEEVNALVKAGETGKAKRLLAEMVKAAEGLSIQAPIKARLAELEAADREETKKADAVAGERAKLRQAEAELEAIEQVTARGDAAVEEGRRLAEKPGKAIAAFESAIGSYDRAIKAARGYKPSAKLDPAAQSRLSEEASLLHASARSQKALAHIEIGFAYVSRKSLKNATDHAGEAAALDPHNPRVNELRIAIAAASAEDER